MNDKFENYKKNFIEKNCYYEDKISGNEYFKLEDDSKKDYIKELEGNGEYKYCKKISYTFNDSDELKLYMEMVNYKTNKNMNKNMGKMKNIMSFWLVLSIINLIGIIYMAGKISSIIR